VWYSESFKKSVVTKLLSPNGPSEKELVAKTGISKTSLARWKTMYGQEFGAVMPSKHKKNATKWTPEKVFQAVLETQNMGEEELGSWCRSSGVHTAQLEEWKKRLLSGVSQGRQSDPEKRVLQEQMKGLKRELRRKEKALAETMALLALKKKLDIYFGEDEDDI